MLPFGEGRGNLVARLGRGDAPPLCFTGHLDTVPLGDADWSCDPFGGELRDGRISGLIVAEPTSNRMNVGHKGAL